MYDLRQFLIYKIEHRSDGRIDKIPLHPETFRPHDAHDPAVWMDYNTALQTAIKYPGHGVGFTFTEQDPYFFLDLDAHLQPNGQWLPITHELCAMFLGCYMETSVSGRGLHIIGAYRSLIPHAIDNKQIQTSLYTSKRFVALTGTHAQGNPRTEATAALHDLITRHFIPGPTTITSETEWSDRPVPEWHGIEDDTELIGRAVKSRSGASVFGGKASFQDLWTASENLGKFFPDPIQGRAFDHSTADAALFQHLAFWTGKNCERMVRLGRMSALARDKWDNRADYLHRTILGAVAGCTKVYGEREVSTGPENPMADYRAGTRFMSCSEQTEYFAGCAYIRDIHKIWTPDGSLLKPEQFRAMYGGYRFALDASHEKDTKNAWEVFTESQAISFPKAHSVCFRPEVTPGTILQEEDRLLLNTYVPVNTARKQGNPSPLLDLIEKMIPDPTDRAIILSYMASLVQNPGVKFQWCPVLQGCDGNGKTVLISVLANAVGWRYTHLPNASDLAGNGTKFNAWLSSKLFIGIEEIYVPDKRELMETLKPYITNARLEIQGKGADQITGDNRANFMMCTNHKDGVIKTRNDRRYSIFYTAQQCPEDIVACGWGSDYFPRLYKWLREEGYAIANNFLREYQIDARFDPAGICQRAPITSSTNEAIGISLGRVEQEILEAVAEERQGFKGGWVSSMRLSELFTERKVFKISNVKTREIMASLGYTPHPALRDGRASSLIPNEHGKPRLYVRRDSIQCNSLIAPADVVRFYCQAQGYAVLEVGPTADVVGNRR